MSIVYPLMCNQQPVLTSNQPKGSGAGSFTDRDDDNKSQRAEECAYEQGGGSWTKITDTEGDDASKKEHDLIMSPPRGPITQPIKTPKPVALSCATNFVLSPGQNPNANPEVYPTRNWVNTSSQADKENRDNTNALGKNFHPFPAIWNQNPTKELRQRTQCLQSPPQNTGAGFFNSIISPVKITTGDNVPYYGPNRSTSLSVIQSPDGRNRSFILSPRRRNVPLMKFTSPTKDASTMSPVKWAYFSSPNGYVQAYPQQQPSSAEGSTRTRASNSLFSPGVGAMIGRMTGMGGEEMVCKVPPEMQRYIDAQISSTPRREVKWSKNWVSPKHEIWQQPEPSKGEVMYSTKEPAENVHPGGGYVKSTRLMFNDPSVVAAVDERPSKFPTLGAFPNAGKHKSELDRDQTSMNQKLKDLWTSGSKSTSPTGPAPDIRPSKDDHRMVMDTILSHDEAATIRMVKDARGSRQVQDALDRSTEEERLRLFGKLVNHAHDLCTDQFGHYVIQKFFLLGSELQKRQLVKQLKGHFVSLAKHNIGCRVMQRAAAHLSKTDFLAVVEELATVSAELSRDTSASHVLQKLLERHECLVVQRLMPGMQGKFVSLCKESFSCRIVQRLLELRDDGIRKSILKEVMTAVYPLSKQEFGNYIIQHVIKHFNNSVVKKIYKLLHPHLLELATNKFSSNVLEHLYLKGCSEVQGSLVHMVCQTEFLDTCVRDRFGNYFVQIILGSSIKNHRRALANILRERYGSGLEDMQYGKYIAMKLAKLKISPERGNKSQKRRTSDKKEEKGRRSW